MNDKFAKYPFLNGAKNQIGQIDIDLNDIFSDDVDDETKKKAQQIKERALNRVLNAIKSRDVGETHDSMEIEFLSYPASRILVSAISESSLINRYATAEAETASNRIIEDMKTARKQPDFKNTDELLDRETMIDEFGLTSVSTTRNSDGQKRYEISVGDYLPLANNAWGDEWELVHRAPNNGVLTVSPGDMDSLLKAAIKRRIKEGNKNSEELPAKVPQPIMDATKEMRAEIMDELRDRDLVTEIDSVIPDLFPPCMKKLLDMLRNGEPLNHHSRVALGTFFVNIGMTTDESVEMMEVHPDFDDGARYHMDHLSGKTGPVEYNVPACSTMKSYGDCYNPDSLCGSIKHPMAYYEAKLDSSEADNYTDWRENHSDKNNSSDMVDESGDTPVFNPNGKSGNNNNNGENDDTKKEVIEPKKGEQRNDSDGDALNAISDDEDDVDVFDPSNM